MINVKELSSYVMWNNDILAPLVYIDPDSTEPNKIAVLIGIVSWGAACGYAEYPDVYTSVRDTIHWIKSETGKIV